MPGYLVAISRFLGFRECYLPYGSLRDRIFTGVSWSFASSVVLIVANAGISIVCGRLLGKEGFGELGMVRNTVLLVAALGGSGLATAAMKHVAEFRMVNREKLGRLVGILTAVCLAAGLLTTLLFYFFAAPIADLALNAGNLAFSLKIASLLMLFQMLQGMQTAVLSGFEAFRLLALLTILDMLFLVALVPAGIFFFDLNGALAGYVTASALGCSTRYFAITSECRVQHVPVQFKMCREDLGMLWGGTTPLVILWVVWQGADWLARLPLAHQSGGYAELGIFMAALTWSNFTLFVPQQLSAPVFPILANLFATRDLRRFFLTVRSASLVCAGMSLATAIPLIILSKFILGLYGHQYQDGWVAMTVLVVACAINGIARVPAQALIVSGHSWLHCLLTLLWGIALYSLAILFQEHGALGLALGYMLAHTIYLVFHVVAYFKIMKKRIISDLLHESS